MATFFTLLPILEPLELELELLELELELLELELELLEPPELLELEPPPLFLA